MIGSRGDGLSRRAVLTAAAAAVPLPAASAGAAADRTEAVAAAVEALRAAIQAGDAAALDRLTHPDLTYGHSSGRKNQDKAAFVASLAGRTNYRTLTFTDQSIRVVGDNALVRHVWDGADILADGQVGRSHIAVLQVWLRDGERWRLLARQSCPLKDAA